MDVGSQLEATAAFTTFTTYPAIDALDWAINVTAIYDRCNRRRRCNRYVLVTWLSSRAFPSCGGLTRLPHAWRQDHTNYYRVRVAAVEALTRLVLPVTDYDAKYKLLEYLQKEFFGDEVRRGL